MLRLGSADDLNLTASNMNVYMKNNNSLNYKVEHKLGMTINRDEINGSHEREQKEVMIDCLVGNLF